MKKKILVLMAVGLLLGSGLFADREFGPGNRGGNAGCPGPGYFGGMHSYRYRDAADAVTVTGTVQVEQDKIPVLKANGRVYALMYPWFMNSDLKLENGMKVTVEGYVRDSAISGDSMKIMLAEKITVGDKTYQINRGRPGGPGWDDDDFHHHHGRGPFRR
jgi:hypothetical protein